MALALKVIMEATDVIDVWINNTRIAHVGHIMATEEQDLDRLHTQ